MTSNNFCLDRRISDWTRRTARRYRAARGAPLALVRGALPLNGAPTGVSQNAVQRWDKLNMISAHTSSGRLLVRSELYVSFYTAFSCFGGGSPLAIRSKRAVAGFGVMKGAITGLSSSLRGRGKAIFCYKWAFLEPAVFTREKAPPGGRHALLGVEGVFVFPELERFDYNLFAPVRGFDLAFHYTGVDYQDKNAEKRT